MNKEKETAYCPECRKLVNYYLKQVPIIKSMRGIDYGFFIYEAHCIECDKQIGIKGLDEENKESLEEQYYKQKYIYRQSLEI